MLPRPTTDYVYNSTELLADPDSVFDRIRADGGIVWCPSIKRWIVVSMNEAVEAMKSNNLQAYDLLGAFNRIEKKSGEVLKDLLRIYHWLPFFYDGKRHQQLRSLFARTLADIRPDYLVEVEAASQRLLDSMLAKGGGNFAKEYADRLHVEALGTLAGFDEADRLWISENFSSQGSVDFSASMGEMIDANRRAGSLLDYIGRLVANASDSTFFVDIGRHLTAVGLADNYENRMGFFTGLTALGRDSLSGTLTLGLAYLLDQNNGELSSGDHWNDLPNMADEIIRLTSSVQGVYRLVAKPIKLGGVDIAAGDLIIIFLPAANRDPQSFPCPHAHNAENGENIAFGAGRHLCVGMPVSRDVVSIALQNLAGLDYIKALPGRELARSKNTRKYDSLPVEMKK
jgi:cytochrome P450